jgi:DNA polymerase III alpha subunit
MDKKNSDNLDKFVIVRSFLGANSEALLESLNQFRHANKVDSDDLFGDSHETTVINYNLQFTPRTKKDILIEEKNSLGLYVSGNPLADYRELVTSVQDAAYTDEVNLILINKIKKIFTKKNLMMFALLVSTPFGDYEAIIFPKKAMGLSPILQEKELFWVTGKIDEGNRSENSKVNDEGETTEYEQKPKILINNMVPIDGDLIGLLSEDKKVELELNEIESLLKI